ncbi:MAG: vWA domain-containing protein [Haloferacaceae archaeon]
MTDNNGRFDLSRRKLLGSVATLGAAGAIGGAGTIASLRDQETFANNQLTAGELDLKVDWEEHYSDWSDDESTDLSEAEQDAPGEDGTGSFSIQMDEPKNPEEYTPYPPGTNRAGDTPEPLVWVPDEFVDDFMRNTAIDAFPDDDNDGTGEFPVEELLPNKKPCDVLADVGGLEKSLGTYTTENNGKVLGRTDNNDTRLANGDPAPLINLEDVKPGDFGEVTFSTHLCDNPGYLWMNMPGGLRASENGVTDPEGDDKDEKQNTVELVDEIQTAIWYDNNCDNLVTGEEKLEVMLVLDTSESITGDAKNTTSGEDIDRLIDGANTFLDALPNASRVRAGLMTFNGDIEGAARGRDRVKEGTALRKGLGTVSQFDTDGDGNANAGQFLPVVGTGDSPIPHAIDLSEQVLLDQGRPDARKVIVLVSDGLPDYTTTASTTVPYEVTDPDTGTTYNQQDSYTGASDGGSSCAELDATQRAADTAKANGVDILGVGIDVGLTACDPDNRGTASRPTPDFDDQQGSGDGNSNDIDDSGTDNVGGDTFLINSVVGVKSSPGTAEPNFYFDADAFGGGGNNFANIGQALNAVVQQLLGGQTAGDEVIFRGTLREAEQVLTDGEGIPLDGDRDTAFDELNDPDDSDSREPFIAGSTACFGFAWWLPLNHGNEVQSDSVRFDLGFYTEQARHNDGGVGNS